MQHDGFFNNEDYDLRGGVLSQLRKDGRIQRKAVNIEGRSMEREISPLHSAQRPAFSSSTPSSFYFLTFPSDFERAATYPNRLGSKELHVDADKSRSFRQAAS